MTEKAPRDPRLLAGSHLPPNRPEVPRWKSVLLMLFAAAIVGGAAGLLSHAGGNNIPAAILTGGGAFAGTVGLLLAIAHYASAR
ncbi:hypothetical protein BJ973_005054 [Actinoplanes tereljensis]|uniref:Uncharacterized protein n=1 Tax=Paractinoplanes tereljensis TaxID=571912 RepID=A0A919TTB5_9ACTN|nr:hypothetical protein Ate02nite_42310 [Actinoplanes tereljensis]